MAQQLGARRRPESCFRSIVLAWHPAWLIHANSMWSPPEAKHDLGEKHRNIFNYTSRIGETILGLPIWDQRAPTYEATILAYSWLKQSAWTFKQHKTTTPMHHSPTMPRLERQNSRCSAVHWPGGHLIVNGAPVTGASWGVGWIIQMLTESDPLYPLVNIQKTMENHHGLMGKSTISIAIFHSYVELPEGNLSLLIKIAGSYISYMMKRQSDKSLSLWNP